MEKLVILGAGESGIGAARLAMKKGYEVFLSDSGEIREERKKVLWNLEVEFEEGRHTEEKVLQADEVIKSPGIPDTASIVEKIRKKGVPVISEIEFGYRFADAPIIGVTGSNGKTTTTMLTSHILEKAGMKVGMGGNVGRSFAGMIADEERFEVFVLELSSFQLEGIVHFRPNIAILLNITPDHLERYEGSMEAYAGAKFRIVMNQNEEDAIIFSDDDEWIRKGMKKWEVWGRKYPISLHHKVDQGAYIEGNNIKVTIKEQEITMSVFDLKLKGQHNHYNSMAAGVASRILEIRKEVIRESLADFQNAEHRLEYVATVHGITFINDSKATNINASWYALESFDGPLIWIVGGVDKGNDYESLKPMVKEKVKAIICLTSDPKPIHEVFGDTVDQILDSENAFEAVGFGYQLAQQGDTVLMSPACASFDLFENFEDRGHQFKSAVKAL